MVELIGDLIAPSMIVVPDYTYGHQVPLISGAMYMSGALLKWTRDDAGTIESW